MKSKVLFDHIPKCGGSSVNAFLKSAVGSLPPFITGVPALLALDWFSRYHVIAGHFGGRVLFPELGVKTVTVLRDPLDRMISHFYHYQRGKNRVEMTLDSVLDSKSAIGGVLLSNPMARHLAAAKGQPMAEEKIVDLAKEHLSEYELVGITEDLPSFFGACSERFGWPAPPGDIHRRRGENRKPMEPALQDRFRERLALDYEIYNHTKALVLGTVRKSVVKPAQESASGIAVDDVSLNGVLRRSAVIDAMRPIRLKFAVTSTDATGRANIYVTLRYGENLSLGRIHVSRVPAVRAGKKLPITVFVRPPLLAGLFTFDVTVEGIANKKIFANIRNVARVRISRKIQRAQSGLVNLHGTAEFAGSDGLEDDSSEI